MCESVLIEMVIFDLRIADHFPSDGRRIDRKRGMAPCWEFIVDSVACQRTSRQGVPTSMEQRLESESWARATKNGFVARNSDSVTVSAYADLIVCRNPIACSRNVDVHQKILIYASVGDHFPTTNAVIRLRAFNNKSLLVCRIVIPRQDRCRSSIGISL